MGDISKRVYWQLSGFYFFYFASIGALLPYWSLYLQSHNYTAQQIALTFAIIMGTKIIAPNIWGWLADKSGRRMGIIRTASLLSLLTFTGVFYSMDFYWIVLIMVVYSFFWNANLPQFEAVTLAHLGKKTHRYSTIRLWGSLGFVLLVSMLGPFFEQYDINSLPIILCFLLFGICLFSWVTPEATQHTHHDQSQNFVSIIKKPVVILFFLLVFLLQASHGPYYAFYSIYLENNGYSRTIIGQFWALGVISEIVIFIFMYKLLNRWRVEVLLISSLVLASVRWLLIANFVESFSVLFFAQLLHAASFGIFHASSIHLIHKYFPHQVQGRGQALYSSLSFGAGGALGAIYSGFTWDTLGSQWTYTIAAFISALAVLVGFYYLKLSKSSSNETPMQTKS